MGCCYTKTCGVPGDNYSKILYYIEKSKINLVSCLKIKKIEKKTYDFVAFNEMCKKLKIRVPFELLNIGDYIPYFELKFGLLFISNDTYEKKVEIYSSMIKNERYRIRFLE